MTSFNQSLGGYLQHAELPKEEIRNYRELGRPTWEVASATAVPTMLP